MRLPSVFTLIAIGCLAAEAQDWPRFRGPNGSGVSEATALPVEFGPARNLLWRTPVPAGHSSPVLAGDRVLLTACEQDRLITLCLDRDTGPVHPAVCSAAPSTGSRGLSLRVTTRRRMSPAVLRVHVSASRASARTVPQRLPTRKPHPLSQQSQKALQN